MTIDFDQPESARGIGGELASSAHALAVQLRASTITDVASLEQSVIDRQMLGEMMKRVANFFAPFKQRAHELHKMLCASEYDILAPLQALDNEKRNAIRDFKVAQDRIREQREREEAERRRQDDEARAEAAAASFERAGDHEMATAIVAEAIAAPAPIVVLPDVTKSVQGLRFVRRWCWRYSGGPQDVTKTPPAVLTRAMQLIPREFLCVDEKKVGAYVRSMKDTARIPGIDVYHVDDPTR